MDNTEMREAFEKWKERGEYEVHIDGCEFKDRLTPVSECLCDCYELFIWQACWQHRQDEIGELKVDVKVAESATCPICQV